jgi:hypothetical protein
MAGIGGIRRCPVKVGAEKNMQDLTPYIGHFLTAVTLMAAMSIAWGRLSERLRALENKTMSEKATADRTFDRCHARVDKVKDALNRYLTKSEFKEFKRDYERQMQALTDLISKHFSSLAGKIDTLTEKGCADRESLAGKIDELNIKMAQFEECRKRCDQ